MAKEKIAPAQKSVPSSGGVSEGQSTLSTPRQTTDDKAPWGKNAKGATDKIM